MELTVKAVMPVVPPEILEWRKRTGAHRWDEMWKGILHILPSPNRTLQDLEGSLEAYLRLHWARSGRAKVYHQVNLAPPGGWPDDYRIPDLLMLLPEHFALDHNEYFEGAVDGVVEIYSPGDETYDKLPFYEELGVAEAWVIHRDTKEPEVYLLKKGRYRKQRAVAGWVRSSLTGMELRAVDSGKLAIRKLGEDATRVELPED
jgi:Uma2 family endonuclease